MSIAAPTIAAAGTFCLPVPVESLKQFSVADYHAMIDAGMFAGDEDFELLEGLVVRKMTKKPDHWITSELIRAAVEALGIAGFFFHAQNPITTTDSEPEPDGALIRGQRRDYLGGNPDPRQVPLVIEVADSSLTQDRVWKKRIYARASIPVYWTVNLIDRRIEVYTRPTGPIESPDYRDCQIIAEDGQLPVVIDGREVGRLAVKDLLP